MKNLYWIILGLLLFTSCFEEDVRVTPVEIPETSLIVEIPFSMYEYQTYYSIVDSMIVLNNHFADWDLGFESTDDGYHIILNYARYMYAGNTFVTDFDLVNETTSVEMFFDKSDGNLDSTVFVDWADYTDSENPVFNDYTYIIDRGKDELGVDYGMKKIMVEKLENDTFYVHFSNLDNTEDYYFKVPKDKSSNYTLVSLDDGGTIIVSEPDKSTWDICLTKYATKIPDNDGILTDYIVRGVYSNPYKNFEVALDTTNNFYDILPEMINDNEYSGTQDAIGYDWKYYNNDVYIVRDLNSYILRNVSGLNYKIRFISYYNDSGEKGYPAFEINRL